MFLVQVFAQIYVLVYTHTDNSTLGHIYAYLFACMIWVKDVHDDFGNSNNNSKKNLNTCRSCDLHSHLYVCTYSMYVCILACL